MAEQVPSKEQLADERAVEFALRQGERCRNYGPERTENEDCIVILANEVERLRQAAHKNDRVNFETTDDGFRICRGYHHRSADCEWVYYVPRRTHEPCARPPCEVPGCDGLAMVCMKHLPGSTSQPPAPEQPAPLITINGRQVAEIYDFMDLAAGSTSGYETDVSIQWFEERPPVDGEPSPAGYYAWITEYPEEGSIYLNDQPSPTKGEG